MATTIRDLLERNALLYGGEIAVSVKDRTSTWRELARRSRALASALTASGVGRGARIAALQGNSLALVELAYASALAGAVMVPVSPRLAPEEVRYLLADAEVEAVVADAELAGLAAHLDRPVVVTGSSEYEQMASGEGAPLPHSSEDDIVLQLYTSGTTGRPKGALLSQRALIANGYTTYLSQRLSHDDVFLSATPLTHAAGATRIYTLALDGLTHVILPRYDIDAFLQAIAAQRVTTTILVPTMLRMLLDHPALDDADLSSLRTIVYGAAPTPRDLIEEAMDRLECGFVHAYGLTEGCPALTALGPEEHRRAAGDADSARRLASVGRPVAGVSLRVTDDDGVGVATGVPGELWVRSDKTMSGYWRQPEQTAAVLADGWLATGDIGYLDDDGYLFLVDRKKDLIISGGMNVYPSEIERVLLAQPSIREAAVVGRPHERWGEVPVAFAVANGDGATPQALLDRCRSELAAYKVPNALHLVPALPRNETGKVVKAALLGLLTY